MPLRTMEFFKGGGILELRILTEKATEKKKKKKKQHKNNNNEVLNYFDKRSNSSSSMEVSWKNLKSFKRQFPDFTQAKGVS